MSSDHKRKDSHAWVETYHKTDVMTANRETILLMMYAGAIRFLKKAIEANDTNRIEEKGRYIVKTQEIVSELRATLDFEVGGEIANNLDTLYDFVTQRLLGGNLNRDTQQLREALNVLVTLKGTWEEAIQSLKNEKG